MGRSGLRTRLFLCLLVAGLVPMLLVASILVEAYHRSLDRQAIDRLMVVRDARAGRLTAQLDALEQQARTFAGGDAVRYALGRFYGFDTAFRSLSDDPRRAGDLIRLHYGLAPIAEDAPARATAERLSSYQDVSQRFMVPFRAFADRSGFVDLFLVNRDGWVLFGLQDRAPLGRPVDEIGGGLAAAVQALAAGGGDVALVPDPAPGDGVAYLALPVTQYGAARGTLVLRLGSAPLLRILAGGDGLGSTGRLSLLGIDGVPRLPAEADPAVGRAGPAGERLLSRARAGHAVAAPLSAGEGPELFAALAPVDHGGVRWLLAAEQEAAEARAAGGGPSAGALVQILGGGAVLAVLVAAGLTGLLAARPLSAASSEPRTGAQDPAPGAGRTDDAPAGARAAGAVEDHPPADADQALRQAVVAVMTTALALWTEATGKDKVSLAEESGIWRVYLDRSTPQTRTLDRYLLPDTVPRRPRWRDVLRTAYFVLDRCPQTGPARAEVEAATAHLKGRVRGLGR